MKYFFPTGFTLSLSISISINILIGLSIAYHRHSRRHTHKIYSRTEILGRDSCFYLFHNLNKFHANHFSLVIPSLLRSRYELFLFNGISTF